MPAEETNEPDIKTNTSPSDAREILDDYKSATVKEFVASEFPDSVSVEKLEHARLRRLKHDVGDSLDDIKQTLKDVAQLKGMELDTKTQARLEGAAQALENCDDQVADQIEMFNESEVPEMRSPGGAEIIDVEAEIEDDPPPLEDALTAETLYKYGDLLRDAGITNALDLATEYSEGGLQYVNSVGPVAREKIGKDLYEYSSEVEHDATAKIVFEIDKP
jgi:DNA-binding transcriptional MerR regulator